MRHLLIRGMGLLAILSAGNATAADMGLPVKAPPPPPAIDIWNGFYGGVNAGIGISRNPTNDTTALPGLTPSQFDTGLFSHSSAGGIFGLQAGWNWHAAPSWVLGVEADWQWSDRSDTVCTYACLPAAFPPALLSITDQETMKWFGTARGRIGWLSPGGSLLYATGGLAWGRVDENYTLTGDTFFAAGPSVAASFSQTKVGWTLGAGIETPIAPRWTLKAEYLYVDLGTVNNTFANPLSALAAGPFGFAPATAAVTTSTVNLHDNIVRLGLNYHFDAPSGAPMAYASSGALMAYKAPPQATGWNGFYGGLNAGGAIAHNPTSNPFVFSPATSVLFPVGGADTYTHAPFGGLVGVQLGGNWRVAPSWVVGGEVDWQWTHQTDSACVSQCLIATATSAPGTPLAVIDDQTIDWFGTARARVGWIAPNGALWYATGGMAWGHVEDTVALVATPGFFAPGAQTEGTFSHDRVGWTVGAGAEIPLWDRWSAKAEYLYVDLGNINDSFTSATTAAGVSQTTGSVFSVHDHIFRLGANYHFN